MLGQFMWVLDLEFVTAGDDVVGVDVVILLKTPGFANKLHGVKSISNFALRIQVAGIEGKGQNH